MSVESVIVWAERFGQGRVVELWGDDAPSPVRGQRGAVPIRWPGKLVDVPVALPLELLALGVADIRIAQDPCDEELGARICEWEALFGLVHRELKAPEPGKAKRDVLHADQMPTVQRRSLFGLGAAVANTDPNAWTPDHTATPHWRLRAAIRQLVATSSEPLDDAPSTDSALGPGVQLLANGCTAQGQCVQACPQQALQLRQGAGESTLSFDPSLCDGCRRCIEFCDQDALQVVGRLPWSAVRDGDHTPLATVETKRCERCKTAFAPRGDETLCAVCEARRANPFGSSLPPEAIARLKRLRQQRGPDGVA